MGQMQKISKNNTKVRRDHEGIRVYLHGTRVVKVTPTEITLNSGGWQPATTKARMNQTSNEFDLGFGVFQKNHKWFVRWDGKDIPFEDNMVIFRNLATTS